MQDRYEVPVNVIHPDDFHVLDGCTFDQKPHDLCYQQWLNDPYVYGKRGAYASNGLAASMITRSATASSSDIDLITFGGPIDFTGYFPGWGDAAVADHKHFSVCHARSHLKAIADLQLVVYTESAYAKSRGNGEASIDQSPRHARHRLQLL